NAPRVSNLLAFLLAADRLERLEMLGLLPDLHLGFMAFLALAVALREWRGNGPATRNCERQECERERSSRHASPPKSRVEQRIVLAAEILTRIATCATV